MRLEPNEIAFLKDLALSKDSWVAAAREGVTEPSQLWFENEQAWKALAANLQTREAKEAFERVVTELLSGLVHSVLVTLDGGTQLAESTLLSITDGEGYEFSRHLHESWPLYSGALE